MSSLGTSVDFSGLWIPLVTPFRQGAVDHAALAALVKRLHADGVAGLVVCGSTGEAAALDTAEQDAVLATVLRAAAGLAVVMGVSGYHLGHTLERVAELNSQPLAGLLVAAPHYIRPSQAGLQQWFEAIASASRHAIIVYDIPYRTGATLELATLRALAAHPNIRALKDCGGNTTKTQALIGDGQLQVLAGEDIQIFTTVALGGVGAIAASAHVHTRRFVELLQRLQQHDLPAARDVWHGLRPLVELAFAEPNPGPVKALLALQDEMTAELRAPMTPASAALLTQLKTLL
ncbi:4-hydroxy-tetrahydrodipicolinate synthase [Variovorax sp. HJSM1_2]|uniref:4-hydroxy-tetrahydrodipicolinate synthase n=1 Tax=Variovorax sp. HJSM1_2 TaxID=3366263 RepID=UPI003BC4C21B